MLPKQKRLTRTEFSRFFVAGRRYHDPAFQVLYIPFPAQKAAVVVGKKIYKHAVDRNHLRRQLYHIIKDWFRNTTVTGVYIIIAKPPARELAFSDLSERVQKVLASVR